MKKLISILGFASFLAFSPLHAQEPKFKRINDRDVPYPTLNQPFILTSYENYVEIEFKIDGKIMLFGCGLISGGTTKDNFNFYGYGRPLTFSVDFDDNGKIERDEVFIIDYENSQTTNPLLEKKSESPKSEYEKMKKNFGKSSGRKKLA